MNEGTEKVTDVAETTLAARGLKKSYGDFEAVKGVDFQVYRGNASGSSGRTGPARPRR